MLLKLQGLLQIRGEIKKSDTVAALLATKAVQSMVAETRFLLMDRLDVEVQMSRKRNPGCIRYILGGGIALAPFNFLKRPAPK